MGLRESLAMLKEEGHANVYSRHDRLARATRAAMQAMGMTLFAERPAESITSVKCPAGLNGDAVYKMLRDRYNITIAGGQDHLKDTVFRVAHLGYYDDLDIITVTAALEMAITDLKFKVPLGAGVAAAQKVLMERA